MTNILIKCLAFRELVLIFLEDFALSLPAVAGMEAESLPFRQYIANSLAHQVAGNAQLIILLRQQLLYSSIFDVVLGLRKSKLRLC